MSVKEPEDLASSKDLSRAVSSVKAGGEVLETETSIEPEHIRQRRATLASFIKQITNKSRATQEEEVALTSNRSSLGSDNRFSKQILKKINRISNEQVVEMIKKEKKQRVNLLDRMDRNYQRLKIYRPEL